MRTFGGLPRGMAAMWRRAATVSRASPRTSLGESCERPVAERVAFGQQAQDALVVEREIGHVARDGAGGVPGLDRGPQLPGRGRQRVGERLRFSRQRRVGRGQRGRRPVVQGTRVRDARGAQEEQDGEQESHGRRG